MTKGSQPTAAFKMQGGVWRASGAGLREAGAAAAGLADDFFSFDLGIGKGRDSRTGHERGTIETTEGQVKERSAPI